MTVNQHIVIDGNILLKQRKGKSVAQTDEVCRVSKTPEADWTVRLHLNDTARDSQDAQLLLEICEGATTDGNLGTDSNIRHSTARITTMRTRRTRPPAFFSGGGGVASSCSHVS